MQNSNYDLWGLFKYAKHVLTNDELILFVMTLWGIWEAGSKCSYENAKMVPSHVIDRIEGIFQSFVSVQSISGSSEQYNSGLPGGKWEVPPVGWYKLNVDVAVHRVNGKVGHGAVILNNNGHVMVVRVDQVVFSDYVDNAEAEALRFGI